MYLKHMPYRQNSCIIISSKNTRISAHKYKHYHTVIIKNGYSSQYSNIESKNYKH